MFLLSNFIPKSTELSLLFLSTTSGIVTAASFVSAVRAPFGLITRFINTFSQ